MRKWYNVEISDKTEIELFRKFLKEKGGKKICHFEIYLSKEICVTGKSETEFEFVENFLEKFMEV